MSSFVPSRTHAHAHAHAYTHARTVAHLCLKGIEDSKALVLCRAQGIGFLLGTVCALAWGPSQDVQVMQLNLDSFAPQVGPRDLDHKPAKKSSCTCTSMRYAEVAARVATVWCDSLFVLFCFVLFCVVRCCAETIAVTWHKVDLGSAA